MSYIFSLVCYQYFFFLLSCHRKVSSYSSSFILRLYFLWYQITCFSYSTSSMADLTKLWFCVLLRLFLLQAMDISFFYIWSRSNFWRIRLQFSDYFGGVTWRHCGDIYRRTSSFILKQHILWLIIITVINELIQFHEHSLAFSKDAKLL